jgi:hypothetical protein
VKDYQHKMQKFGFTVAGIDSPLGQITYVNSIDEQSVAQAQLKMGDVVLAINFQVRLGARLSLRPSSPSRLP